MNDVMKIIRINGFIQKIGPLMLNGKEIECVALDKTCTFKSDEDLDEIELTDTQVESLFKQTLGI